MNTPISDREKIAWEYSSEKHKDQIRKFINKPYFEAHVQKVNGIVKQWTTNEDILCAALCHDVIEDCFTDKWIGYNEIEKLLGRRVAELVLELTSDNDEIRFRWCGNKTDYLINKLNKMSDDALIIKLSDRLQNISDAFTASDKFRNKYFNETKMLVNSLMERELNYTHIRILDDIKSKLNNISSVFKI